MVYWSDQVDPSLGVPLLRPTHRLELTILSDTVSLPLGLSRSGTVNLRDRVFTVYNEDQRRGTG